MVVVSEAQGGTVIENISLRVDSLLVFGEVGVTESRRPGRGCISGVRFREGTSGRGRCATSSTMIGCGVRGRRVREPESGGLCAV